MSTHIKQPRRTLDNQRSNDTNHTSGAGEPALGASFAAQAEQLVSQLVAERFGKPATDLQGLATALRLTNRHLEDNLGAPYVEKLADGLEHTATLLKQTSARELIDSAQRFGRERPLLFMGAAVAVGFGAGRFLRSSGQAISRAPARRELHTQSPTAKSKS